MAETIVKRIDITQKAKASFGLKLKTDGDGEDLSTNHDIIVYFPGTTTTQNVSKQNGGNVTILNASKGKIQVTVPASITELIKEGEEQDIEIHVIVNNGDDPCAWKVKECLFVEASLS